jgi:hypothetical protein
LTIKRTLYLTIIFAAISLATPFVWLKIGPGGYSYYGPEVPDIFILGGTILGKDKSFWGINFAYKFQLIVILYFIASSFLTIRNLKKKSIVITFTLVNSILLLFFPVWLWIYTGGVICNSDGADLSVHPHVGVLIYLILVSLNVLTLLKLKKETKK